MARRTFLDSNILIAGHHGQPSQRAAALRIMADQDPFFIVSPFLELELVPKALYNKNAAEAEFYRTYFENARVWISDTDATVRIAREESIQCGLNAMDALLVASAFVGGAEEFYTLESFEKPIYRTKLVKVIQLLPELIS